MKQPRRPSGSAAIPKSSFENPEIKYPLHRYFRNLVSKTIIAILETQELISKNGELGLGRGLSRMYLIR